MIKRLAEANMGGTLGHRRQRRRRWVRGKRTFSENENLAWQDTAVQVRPRPSLRMAGPVIQTHEDKCVSLLCECHSVTSSGAAASAAEKLLVPQRLPCSWALRMHAPCPDGPSPASYDTPGQMVASLWRSTCPPTLVCDTVHFRPSHHKHTLRILTLGSQRAERHHI